jgi:uncharacterized membrane protein YcgQ (UPF0703/DUF1980 family)
MLLKKTLLFIIIAGVALAGCGKQESAPKPQAKSHKSGRETLIQEIILEKDKIDGREIRIVGKYALPADRGDSVLTLIQYVKSCCPSHGDRDIRIDVQYPGAKDLPFNSWIQVKGTVKTDKGDPYIVAARVTPVRKPHTAVQPDISHFH